MNVEDVEPDNWFTLQPLVRLDYSFPDVNDKERRKIYDIIFSHKYTPISGGGGDGSTNSGTRYFTPQDAAHIAEELKAAGISLRE